MAITFIQELLLGEGNSPRHVSVAPAGSHIAIALSHAPFARVEKRIGEAYETVASPFDEPIPSLTIAGAVFSPLTGTYLAMSCVASGPSDYLRIYKRVGDSFTLLEDIDFQPGEFASCISWSGDENYLALHSDAGGPSGTALSVYKRTGDSFELLPALPTDVNAGIAGDCDWSADGSYLAISRYYAAQSVQVYKRSGDSFTRLDGPEDQPESAVGLAWSPDSKYLAASRFGSVESTIYRVYKRTGDDLELLPALAPVPSLAGALDVPFRVRWFGPDYVLYQGRYGLDTPDGFALYNRSGDSFTLIPAQPPADSFPTPPAEPDFYFPYLSRSPTDIFALVLFSTSEDGDDDIHLQIYEADLVSRAPFEATTEDAVFDNANPYWISTTDDASAVFAVVPLSRLSASTQNASMEARGVNYSNDLYDSAALGDSMRVLQAVQCLDTTKAASTVTSEGTFGLSATDGVAVHDALRITLNLIVAESLTLSDLLDAKRTPVLVLIDTLVASGIAVSQQSAIIMLAAALAVHDRSGGALGLDMVEELSAVDAVQSRAALYAGLLTEAAISQSMTLARTATAVIVDAPSIGDLAAAGLVATSSIADAVTVDAILYLEGIPYAAWVVSTENAVATEYRNWNFESMCRLGDRYYGASESGLFLLDGDTDDGGPIQASIRTGDLDFGSAQIKRPTEAHLGYTSNGRVVMKVVVVHEGKRTEYWYEAKAPVRGTATESRMPIGKGLASRTWQFELMNKGGAELELETLRLQMLDLSRRL